MMASRIDFVHIMPKEKFTKGFIEFFEQSFPELQVRFIVYGSDDFIGYEPSKSENVSCFDSADEILRDDTVFELIKETEVVVLNWVNYRLLIGLARFLTKTLLLFWGGDLSLFDKDNLTFKEYIKKLYLIRSIHRCRGVIALSKSDLDKIKKNTSFRCDGFIGDIAAPPLGLNLSCDNKAVEEGPLRILLGNSATPTNRHFESLNLLSKFANENIEIICPLSYGEEEYRRQVIARGEELFGSKFIPLLEYMQRERYAALLNSIQIGVFNYNRQQGLGNIRRLLRFGSKVYLAEESGTYEDFCRSGVAIHALQSVKRESFEQFSHVEPEESRRNMELLNEEVSYTRSIERWRAIIACCLESDCND